MYINSNENCTPLIGLPDILNKLSGMDSHFVHRMYSYHTAANPLIEISEDGCYAKGTWFDHSATNLYSPKACEGGLAAIPYMVFIARYVHEFRKIDGQWYLTGFYWEPLINLCDWQFNLEKSEGIVRYKDKINYPLAFETLQ